MSSTRSWPAARTPPDHPDDPGGRAAAGGAGGVRIVGCQTEQGAILKSVRRIRSRRPIRTTRANGGHEGRSVRLDPQAQVA
jgi:hypothetical protein